MGITRQCILLYILPVVGDLVQHPLSREFVILPDPVILILGYPHLLNPLNVGCLSFGWIF